MRTSKIIKLTALAGLALLGSVANAATVRCPGTLTAPENRQIEVSGALAGGECYYQEGNLIVSNNQDDFATWLGNSYVEIEKDVAPGGNITGNLLYTFNANRDAGTWTMASNFWSTYQEIFIAFHFGNAANRSPDSFIVELNPGTLTGNWALLPSNLANGLSNIYLIGRGVCTGRCGPPDQVPEPGSLALLGLGLVGLGLSRRRHSKA